MHLHILSIAGNPNVGLYGFATDKYCIVGNAVTDEQIVKIREALNVPVYQMNLCGTPLVGVFASGHEDCLLVPDLIFESEKKKLQEFGIPYAIVPTTHTALGNNMICNKQVAIVSPDMEESTHKIISKALGVTVQTMTLAKLPIVGSLAVLNKNGCVVSHDASDDEVETLSGLLKVPVDIGTVNFGSGFISSGILCNSNGLIVGSSSTGIEINNADEVLGFLQTQ